jgi:hypothetical protein
VRTDSLDELDPNLAAVADDLADDFRPAGPSGKSSPALSQLAANRG